MRLLRELRFDFAKVIPPPSLALGAAWLSRKASATRNKVRLSGGDEDFWSLPASIEAIMTPAVSSRSQVPLDSSESKAGRWWHRRDGRIVCDLCLRECSLRDGDLGFCFVRQNVGGQMRLNTYGRSTGFCIDPVEKKPLNHFYPGTSVLSFGTAGCNLGCKFCQAWGFTKSREVLNLLSQRATPEMIAEAAVKLGCRSVAFTYNDPVIWAEYAIDTARACHERGLKTIAKTAGYINAEPRREFFEVMDAANVDLKGFTEHFYQHYTLSHLQPVLDTLSWIARESSMWLEITNLVIPDANDSPDDLQEMCEWIVGQLGAEVPLHFTAFHPDFRMCDRSPTPPATLIAAREMALQAGLRYVYLGNVSDAERQSTYCPNCRRLLVERDWYLLGDYHIRDGCCEFCGEKIAGSFENAAGHWGGGRKPVDIAQLLRGLESA
jgi:AmmeMemoRadiSam system radical SAM enzyme